MYNMDINELIDDQVNKAIEHSHTILDPIIDNLSKVVKTIEFNPNNESAREGENKRGYVTLLQSCIADRAKLVKSAIDVTKSNDTDSDDDKLKAFALELGKGIVSGMVTSDGNTKTIEDIDKSIDDRCIQDDISISNKELVIDSTDTDIDDILDDLKKGNIEE